MIQRNVSVPGWLAILIPALLVLAVGALLGLAIGKGSDGRYIVRNINLRTLHGGHWEITGECLIRIDKHTGQTETMRVGSEQGFIGSERWEPILSSPPRIAPNLSTQTPTAK